MKKILALCLLACLVGTSLDAATVAYYKFDGSGTAPIGTVISDLAGTNHGSVAGGDLVYGADPFVGGYLSFDADGADRIVITHAPELVFTTDQAYTFEVVFRTTQFGSAVLGALLSKGCDVSNPDSQYWMRRQDNSTIRGNIEGTDTTTEDNATSSSAYPVNDGKWHHMALVFNGTVSPKKLEVYIDGLLRGSDSSVGTSGVVGGAEQDPLLIGEFASLGANRSFQGDIASVRLSDAALTSQEFLQYAATVIENLTPADGAGFLPASTVSSFEVKSPSIGVASAAIHASLNGLDISSQLAVSGTTAAWSVTLPALAVNQLYHLDISVTDLAGNIVTKTSTFDTFVNGLRFIEAEDYNFQGGQYIDNPQLSSTPGPQNYLDLLGLEGIDYHQTNATVAAALYRIGDQVGTPYSQDVLRQSYIDARVTDPAVSDFLASEFGNTEWLNYTRTFPEATYRVYARVAKNGAVPIVMSLDEVTSGSTGSSQTLAPIGFIKGPATGAVLNYAFVPLVDALGNDMAVRLSGLKTLRLTMLSGTLGLSINYLVFVPAQELQSPYVTLVSPANGADNELPNLTIQASIRNGDSQLTAGSIGLKLNGADVTPNVTTTSLGANLSYTPPTLSTGLYTVTLSYSDTAAKWTTNQWQFRVANLAVRGFWKFDEKVPGEIASTASGAILDFSLNDRNGTSSFVPPAYTEGSADYGNSRALRFNSGQDRVVVPDPNGTFNFEGSFTLEAVIRTTNLTAGAAILAKNGTDGEGEYWWRMPGTGGKAQQIALSGKFLAGTNVVNDGDWHHLAVVYDAIAGEIRLYADYEVEAVTSATFGSPVGRPSDLTIGSFIGGGSEFIGDIDFLRISNGALTPAEFVQAAVVPEQPTLTAVTLSTGSIGFSFATQSGHNYTILSTASLSGTWSEVETFAGNDAAKTVSYPTGGERMFYRVRVD